jgi:hypothetical protein
MLKQLLAVLLLALPAAASVVIDRIAVVVEKHAVKRSEVDRDVRVTQLLNREPLSVTSETRRKAADRLVDQEIIRNELTSGGYGRAAEADAETMLEKLRRDRYANSAARLKQSLAQYGLTEDELRSQLLWQLTVLRFIDERFRPGVLVTDDQVKQYYDQHTALHKVTYEKAAPQIRETLEGEQINLQFENWLDERRKNEVVRFPEGALK